ncbi:usher syndrome type-1G protein [Caerostris extrusa]|uniref:Usher syndrome type-1G protein n=1 Tax=Caerostris extrusa TaxID=172846 RepID=A0AAV4SZ49_CAEEX|nr:usher syndrome type-1G protein [Caerostris extrusa]
MFGGPGQVRPLRQHVPALRPGNGHTDCVSFLVHFGVNLWALDNDFHTAKDVAVLGRRDDALRLLDQAGGEARPPQPKAGAEAAREEASTTPRRIKHYRKRQAKAAKRAEKEEKERAQAGKEPGTHSVSSIL